MIRGALVVAVLVGVYAVVLGSAAPGDLLIGTALAVALLAGTGQLRARSRGGELGTVRRMVSFPRWATEIAKEIAIGVWQVAAVTLRPDRAPPAGVIEIPIGQRTRRGAAVSALAATMSPGEVAIDVDWDGDRILLHVLDARDPDSVRDDHQRIYRRYQREVFP